ncbi:MAG: proton-conducting transporter membrane subunit [Candidatus Limnocylindrales bacterium]
MSLAAFLLACGVGAVLGLIARPPAPVGRVAGVVGLLFAFVAALFIGPTTSLAIGDVTLAGSEYSGLFLACAAGSGLLLGVVALASGWPDEFAPSALAFFLGLAVATTATNPGVALAAAAAAATAGALVIVRATPRSPEADGRLAEFRTVGLAVAGLLFAAITVLRPAWTGESDVPVFVLAFVCLGLALAVRSGAVPFHVPAARLHLSAAPLAPALLLVWIPAGLGLLTVSWSATTFGIRSDWLAIAVALLQAVAVATLVLGALAALVHDELEEIVAYSIVADAGFVLLALAARSDAAAEPVRLWLLVFIVAKAGLVAWTTAVSRVFGTSNVARLRGWLRRAPLLGLALAAIAIGTFGWPGSAVYEARATLIRLALPGQLQLLLVVSIVLSLAYYGRLLVMGALPPTDEIVAGRSERPDRAAYPSVPNTTPSLTPDPAPAAEPLPELGVSGKLAVAWRLSRTLEMSLVVAIAAALALALAFGSLGASNASRFGIPLDTAAHATPTPPPIPSAAVSTPTPKPTLAPHPTGGATSSASPSRSAGPSGSPTPIKTSAPGRPNTD